jgi:polyphenol oxidase
MSPTGIDIALLRPQWPAPRAVRALFTLRLGGVSRGPYASLNLGAHVGDAATAVAENRRRVRLQLQLPGEPVWIEQIHGVDVVELDGMVGVPAAPAVASAAATAPVAAPRADAIVARSAGRVCAVQVADCLPVLIAARDGRAVAAVHAGWRGLAAGVLEAALRRLDVDPTLLMAWLGPAIGAEHFEVGAEVRSVFVDHDPQAERAFAANPRGRWQCDLVALARQRLARAGVADLYGGTWCTYADPARFFSYRRDGRCGRMAALIWLDGSA